MKKTNQKHSSQKGFTLIELSIVLVIIGLIVGGVLVGQDLIKAAEIRATVSQKEAYDAAVNTFRLKYNGIPGDLLDPENFFTGTNLANADGDDGEGDGDGLVEDLEAAGDPRDTTEEISLAGESALFWWELGQADLISERTTHIDVNDLDFTSTTGTVAAKVGSGRFAVAARDGRNYYLLGSPGTTTSSAGDVTWTAGLTPTEAFQLDTKIDDGTADTGSMLAVDEDAPVPGTSGSDSCHASGTYALTTALADQLDCTVSIRTSF